MTLILSNNDVSALLSMADCIAALEPCYAGLAQSGIAYSHAHSDALSPTSRTGATYSLKSVAGVAPEVGVGALRIKSDIVTWPSIAGTRRRVKIPAAPGGRYTGLVLLFSCETGEPLAIFPDGVIQRLRVGATNGLGIKYMARENATRIGIIGSGWQAGAQLMAACAVRPVSAINCFSPNAENRARFCAEMSKTLSITVTPTASAAAAVAGADIVICATNAVEPVFKAEWLQAGMHVSAIKLPEIEPAALRLANPLALHALWRSEQHFKTQTGTGGQTASQNSAPEHGAALLANAPDLAALVSGQVPGRTSAAQISCFINNIGLGMQFAATGAVLLAKALASGHGHSLPTEWFTEDVHP